MVDYLYRGNKPDPLVAELQDRAIQGAEHTIYQGELTKFPDDDPTGPGLSAGDPVATLPWANLDQFTAGVTGGVTDRLIATRQFTDANRYVIVLDADVVPFEPVQYDYDWFDANPGVLTHIVSSSDGEIRVRRAYSGNEYRLYGLAEEKIKMDQPNVMSVSYWGGPDGLPATSPTSNFASESEWVAFQSSVGLDGAIEGVLSFVTPGHIRARHVRGTDRVPGDVDEWRPVLPQVYEKLRDPLPPWVDYYLVVVSSETDHEDGGFPTDAVLAAYRDDGAVEPEHVPARFRGVN